MPSDELSELRASIEAEEASKAVIASSPSVPKKCICCGEELKLNEPYTICTQHGTVGCNDCSEQGYLPDEDAKYRAWPKCPSYLLYRRSDLTCIWLRK